MNSLNDANPDIMKTITEIMSSGEISNEPESQEYELLNTTLMHGMRDVANYLLDKNYKVNISTELDTPASTPLHNAVKLNDIQMTKKLLDKGALMTVIDPGTNTPLHLAFILGYGEVTDLILNHMRDTSNYVNFKNKNGISHLHIASARGNSFVTRELIKIGANITDFVNEDSPIYAGYTSLRFACTYKRLDTLKVLTEALKLHGTITDEDSDDMPHDKLELFKNITRFMINLQQNSGNSSDRIPDFHLACFNDNAVVVEQWLQKVKDINAPINENSQALPLFTPLHMVIEGETQWKVEKVKLLLGRDANVDVRNGFCMTALHLAMYNHVCKDRNKNPSDETEDDETLTLIYAAVMNKQVNPMDCNGLTYLHIAAAMNDFQLAKKILNSGENIDQAVLLNQRQFSTYTPLHFAVKFGHENMANLLIIRGANVNVNDENPNFDTPLQLAIKLGHHRLIDLLLKNKANAKVKQADGNKTTLHLLADRFAETSISTSKGLEEKGELQDFTYKFVRLGVDVNAKDSDGCTALHIACSKIYDSIHLVNWLLMVGADINLENNENDTPFQVACKSGFRGNYDDFFMLYLHVQKLKDLGLKVSEKNEKFCGLVMERKKEWMKNEDWPNFEKKFSAKELGRKRQKRLQEIKKLKTDIVTDGFSLYDYVRMDSEIAAAYIDNERLKKIVEKDDWDEYEVYGYLIPAVYRKSLKWLADQQLEKLVL